MKTKCARPCKSFKVTPFKQQNVSGRIDVKMLMAAGTERVMAQTLQILRPLFWALTASTAPTSCWNPHTQSQGAWELRP